LSLAAVAALALPVASAGAAGGVCDVLATPGIDSKWIFKEVS